MEIRSARTTLLAAFLAAAGAASLVASALAPSAQAPAALASEALASAPSARPAASDEAALLAMHATILKAHRESNPDLLLAGAAKDFIQANRGEIQRPSTEERHKRFSAYLRSTTFEEYRDLADPIVKVSKDGTLGWVIAQVRARGVQVNESGAAEPLTFTSAWIELYEKRDGRWLGIGNLSNFKP